MAHALSVTRTGSTRTSRTTTGCLTPMTTLVIDEDDDTLAIFEWSAPPGCATDDRDAWGRQSRTRAHDQRANHRLRAAHRPGVDISDRGAVPVVRGRPWRARSRRAHGRPRADESSTRAPGAPVALAWTCRGTGPRAYIALASTRADGLPHVEVIASRAGTEWVGEWLQLRTLHRGARSSCGPPGEGRPGLLAAPSSKSRCPRRGVGRQRDGRGNRRVLRPGARGHR
jgi:hypothetical protein